MEEREDLKEELEEVREELQKEEDRIKELEEKVKKLEEIAKSANIRSANLQRELDYLRERYRRDLEEQRKYGHEKIALDILNILDNFERALSAASATRDFDALLKGVNMIYSELRKVLEKHSIYEIEVEGKEFDPYVAEAVETKLTSEYPPNTVIKVVQKGYRLHDKVIRPARVVVSVSEEDIT